MISVKTATNKKWPHTKPATHKNGHTQNWPRIKMATQKLLHAIINELIQNNQ